MADVSRDQLKKEITAILKNADLGKTSAKKVRQQLEEKLDVDLTDKKKMVDDLVMDYLKDQKNKGGSDEDDEENGDEDEEDEESEEEKKKPKKRGPPAKKAKKAASESEEEEDDEKESGDEYSPKKKAKPAPKKGKGKKKGSDGDDDEDWGKKERKAKKPRGGGGGSSKGYTKTLQLSKDLAKLVGQEQMARHEVVKKVWAIIKERNLYDPKNKQFAICDDELYKVIGEKRFRIFGMMKYLKDHFS